MITSTSTHKLICTHVSNINAHDTKGDEKVLKRMRYKITSFVTTGHSFVVTCPSVVIPGLEPADFATPVLGLK